MGFFKSIFDAVKESDKCCANCRFFKVEQEKHKKDLPVLRAQRPYEKGNCSKFEKKIC